MLHAPTCEGADLATHAAISTIGEAVLALLDQACPRPEFEGARFRLYQASDFKAPMDEGLSLFLFRVVPSSRRNLPPRTDAEGRHYRRPLAVDLHYLLTPWARTANRQHRLLAWAMRTLEDTPTLTAPFLNHYSGDSPSFMSDESVTLVFDPLSIQDMLNVWEVQKHNFQVSATYAARLVLIDSLAQDELLPPVQTHRRPEV